MLFAIASCHWDRPDCTRRCLDHLAKCDGIEDCVLFVGVEPGYDEVIDMLRGFDACLTEIVINPRKLGCNENTIATIERGFVVSDFVVFLDDDLLAAPDTLRYLEWARDHYRDRPDVFSITSYNRDPARGRPEAVHTRKWFCPWLVGIWEDRWALARGLPYHENLATWDSMIRARFFEDSSLPYREAFPALSRGQNIGTRSSIHSKSWFSPAWHKANQEAPHWAGDGAGSVPADCAYYDAGETDVTWRT